MNSIFATLTLTFLIMFLTAALFGTTGSYYLVAAAGLPHFILGFFFSVVSILHGRPRRRVILAWLGLISLAACLLYARFPLFDLVGAYFVIHMFRDEVFMSLNRRADFNAGLVATASSGAANVSRNLERAWVVGRIFLIVALASFIIGRVSVLHRPSFPMGLYADPSNQLTGSVPLDLILGGAIILLLGGLALFPRQGLAALHLPMEVRDFLALFVVVSFAAQLRESTLFLALFHYVSWYLFYGEKLRARQRAAERRKAVAPASFRSSPWLAVMNRPRPFAALIIGANILSVAALALYLWHPDKLGFLKLGYDYTYFPYWTIPHVTLSFIPRR
ncbi:MAG: hypothetical protein ACE5HD_08160 [Acidobacteriota bacterium]